MPRRQPPHLIWCVSPGVFHDRTPCLQVSSLLSFGQCGFEQHDVLTECPPGGCTARARATPGRCQLNSLPPRVGSIMLHYVIEAHLAGIQRVRGSRQVAGRLRAGPQRHSRGDAGNSAAHEQAAGQRQHPVHLQGAAPGVRIGVRTRSAVLDPGSRISDAAADKQAGGQRQRPVPQARRVRQSDRLLRTPMASC